MKSSPHLAAAVFLTLFAAGVQIAAAQSVPCNGPFLQCGQEVRAVCSLDPDGVQRMTYWDNGGGSTMVFQRCVGNIYVSRGLPNPYDSGNPAGTPDLPFPRTTLNYSANNP